MTQAKGQAQSQIHHLPRTPVLDPIFFHKTQLKLGTRLEYWGRTAPRSLWEVTRVVSFSRLKGRLRSRAVDTPLYLSDDLHLVCFDGKGAQPHFLSPKVCSFSYLSYSAIWRLM